MSKLRKCFLLAVWLVAFATIPINSHVQQSRPASKEWLVNLPSSPLSLSLASKVKAIRFDSRSTGNIVGFRLGCVAEANDGFTVLEVVAVVAGRRLRSLYWIQIELGGLT